ncbi:putative ubiquitin-conjugating enzyme E2 38 isoform X2 [Rutidosis leptorrhynchoides]|uniref:putative ubiquitin-conjugating enzyme E2 38 isoform X2 n=1 Tax=Rutidosis leptorrhynchoides TaxID=125765 RepID=UPI003A990F6D
MDSTAIAKKRVFTGSSSSPCMDPDVIEIAPPSADEISKFKSKSKTKRKQISSYEIIDVDMDEDCSDVVFIDARVECNSKRKRSMGISLGPSSASQSNSKAMVNSASTVQPNGVDPPSRRRSTNKGVTITSNVKTVVAQNMNPSYNNGSSIVGSSSRMARPDNDDVLITYECFNKFDTVVDYSDHFYSKENSAMKQPPKKWAKRIQKEWRILENDLPDTIFVRVYESRMDILRAAIIGAEGTPYHDGLFFFDVYFPSDYPNSPPLVKYCSGGLHINPNLYDDGYVCLSLLSTWDGSQQSWIPGTSTMLQVLVSIQGLVLNTRPYFNEPGFAHSIGTAHGERRSLEYNEDTLISSLKTMVYTMNKPPKNFEELVVGHFRNRVGDILMACKAYMEGVQVGCFVRGGVQHVDEGDNRSCSTFFKNDISSYIKTLISAFKKIGAKTSSRKEISRKANAIGF